MRRSSGTVPSTTFCASVRREIHKTQSEWMRKCGRCAYASLLTRLHSVDVVAHGAAKLPHSHVAGYAGAPTRHEREQRKQFRRRTAQRALLLCRLPESRVREHHGQLASDLHGKQSATRLLGVCTVRFLVAGTCSASWRATPGHRAGGRG